MKRRPQQVLHQPLDALDTGQIETRWAALCDYYGIQFGAHDWRTALLCALATDRWAGFRAARNKRGKPNAIHEPTLLQYVVSAVGRSPAPEAGALHVVAGIASLLAALRQELREAGKKPRYAWLAERLSKHKRSPWRGCRPETLRSTMRKLSTSDSLPLRWKPIDPSRLKEGLRDVAKVDADNFPFWIPPTFSELYPGYVEAEEDDI